jgi:hypothetical protein
MNYGRAPADIVGPTDWRVVVCDQETSIRGGLKPAKGL